MSNPRLLTCTRDAPAEQEGLPAQATKRGKKTTHHIKQGTFNRKSINDKKTVISTLRAVAKGLKTHADQKLSQAN